MVTENIDGAFTLKIILILENEDYYWKGLQKVFTFEFKLCATLLARPKKEYFFTFLLWYIYDRFIKTMYFDYLGTYIIYLHLSNFTSFSFANTQISDMNLNGSEVDPKIIMKSALNHTLALQIPRSKIHVFM